VKTDICIRGAGIVGQVLALLLARSRIRVSLSASKTTATDTDIRSYALNAASRQLLTDLRAWPEQVCPVQRMQVFGDAQGHIAFEGAQEPLAWIVDAADLAARLTAAIDYAPEIRFDEEARDVQAELTVICEGRMSTSREAVHAGYERFSYAQHAVAARMVTQRLHQNTAWQWMGPSQVCALLPRGQSVQGNSMALVWSVFTQHARDLMQSTPEAFAQALMQVTQGQLGELSLVGEPASWPLVLAQAHQWSGRAPWGAWVLAGDAAHSVHPLAGQGLNLGLGDAKALAGMLSGKPYFRAFSDAKLLRAYERERKAEAAVLRAATDGLQQVFVSQAPRLQSLRNWGMRSLDGSAALKSWLMQKASGVR
jgi:ubiquinone biosynthesis UbiH/UbiF/VisC/COQ6 family hydroxylase